MIKAHGERAHAKYSASSMDRTEACPGSVALSEGLPDKDNPYALEGTHCHEVLERILRSEDYSDLKPNQVMLSHAQNAANFISLTHGEARDKSELLIETKVNLGFVHPEAFGTLDSAVVEHFGTLNIIDFKYGKYPVRPEENLQLLFYALGVAHQYGYNFKNVRLTIIQPRVANYDGPAFWDIGILDLKKYISVFQRIIDRAEAEPTTFVEGAHCFFCKAKGKCPLKQTRVQQKAILAFGAASF